MNLNHLIPAPSCLQPKTNPAKTGGPAPPLVRRARRSVSSPARAVEVGPPYLNPLIPTRGLALHENVTTAPSARDASVTVTLSNSTVASNAEAGTVIGAFSSPVKLRSQTAPAGYFVVAGRELIVAWAGTAIVGSYAIQVHALGGPLQTFTIHVASVPTMVAFSPPDGVPRDADGGWTVRAADGSGTVKVLPPVP